MFIFPLKNSWRAFTIFLTIFKDILCAIMLFLIFTLHNHNYNIIRQPLLQEKSLIFNKIRREPRLLHQRGKNPKRRAEKPLPKRPRLYSLRRQAAAAAERFLKIGLHVMHGGAVEHPRRAFKVKVKTAEIKVYAAHHGDRVGPDRSRGPPRPPRRRCKSFSRG